jgi:hypothetical protein
MAPLSSPFKLFEVDRVEDTIDGVADLYYHFSNKDIFLELYQRHLTKRLLLYVSPLLHS